MVDRCQVGDRKHNFPFPTDDGRPRRSGRVTSVLLVNG